MPIGYISQANLAAKYLKTFIQPFKKVVYPNTLPGTSLDDKYSYFFFQMLFGAFNPATSVSSTFNVKDILSIN
jgi:hypothetical protein